VHEVLIDEATKSQAKNSFHIFMSHCHLDADSILALTLDIQRMGFDLYVDWIVDHHLDRSNVTRDSVNTLRVRV
jgi:hypothetical protein